MLKRHAQTLTGCRIQYKETNGKHLNELTRNFENNFFEGWLKRICQYPVHYTLVDQRQGKYISLVFSKTIINDRKLWFYLIFVDNVTCKIWIINYSTLFWIFKVSV